MKPKLSDEESVLMFIDTLQPSFFDRMIGNVHLDFCQLIRIGERIESLFGSRKIKKSFANKSFAFHDPESEVLLIITFQDTEPDDPEPDVNFEFLQ
ncbi:hypothetical protein Lal_00014107 [Lupinus albus]|nr:hypothetical protein Lal_00014107 [Lupinus albus]